MEACQSNLEEVMTYFIRQSDVQIGDVADTWEVVKQHEDGMEDILAVVQTETLADILLTELRRNSAT
jgi:hypothetical protein